jgi:hypothetical protein
MNQSTLKIWPPEHVNDLIIFIIFQNVNHALRKANFAIVQCKNEISLLISHACRDLENVFFRNLEMIHYFET